MSGELERQANLETILRPGEIVGGGYRCDKLIAKGGMAAVWAGANERTGKRVALKVILRSFASNGEAAELFRREALAASKVNHPNVVSIFDVIDHEGMTCIVMELLDGETLGSYLARNGALSLEETAALMLPAMRGVAAANAMGVVHRDLKPGNIFLCSEADGRLLTTKVLDFGISVIMEPVGEKSTETNLVAKFGTPAYMAPEAIECCPNIDGRTDVYGFGVLFFETLTGTLPFVGDPGPDLFARILTDPPPKVTAHRPDLSAEVAHIIDCALAKNANDRFPDVDHFIRAVEDHLLPPPLMARSLSPIAGVSLFRLGETNSGPSIPTASAANHKGPVGRIQRNETVALYSMMGESSHAAGKAEVTQRKNWAGKWADKWVEWIGTVFKNLWRLPHQRAALGATFTALLILTAWLALSSSSRSRGLGNGQSSSSSQPSALDPGPVITPLPTAASPAPAVANQLGVPAAPIDNVQATVQPAPAQTGATPPTRTATPATSSRRSIAAVAPPASNRVFRKGATTRRHRTGTSVPRAGRLSPSDF